MVQSSTKAVFSLEDSVSDYSLKQRPIGKCVLGVGGRVKSDLLIRLNDSGLFVIIVNSIRTEENEVFRSRKYYK